MPNHLLEHLEQHWRDLRGRTYDLLDMLVVDDLDKRLPFDTSQSMYYQFWCMAGTTNSFAECIEQGRWQGWHSPLEYTRGATDVTTIRHHLQQSDDKLFAALTGRDLLQETAPGESPLQRYLRLAEHEAHHHGQLINFIYALELPIPASWADSWALSRD